jgi:hypothetical protein
MRITIRLDDRLLAQAKAEARQRNETLASLIDEGLRLVLVNDEARLLKKKIVLPVSPKRGGVLPGVDLDKSARLLDLMEEKR